MKQVDDILNRCASFELRGPKVSLARQQEAGYVVVRAESDWSSVSKGKPVIDQRSSNLSDLFPGPRAMLQTIFDAVEAGPNVVGDRQQVSRAPGMR